eukprot:TRINITY_DN1160_c1_g1_i1.p1 TRINITY_DN1160_c1_g1~~TRINITY_DN1160_c1_g1_i1.p1  ORF type:complete len:347 (-),score=150.59 TRINITY_DN1160_c1_g1_i1:2-985(-)
MGKEIRDSFEILTRNDSLLIQANSPADRDHWISILSLHLPSLHPTPLLSATHKEPKHDLNSNSNSKVDQQNQQINLQQQQQQNQNFSSGQPHPKAAIHNMISSVAIQPVAASATISPASLSDSFSNLSDAIIPPNDNHPDHNNNNNPVVLDPNRHNTSSSIAHPSSHAVAPISHGSLDVTSQGKTVVRVRVIELKGLIYNIKGGHYFDLWLSNVAGNKPVIKKRTWIGNYYGETFMEAGEEEEGKEGKGIILNVVLREGGEEEGEGEGEGRVEGVVRLSLRNMKKYVTVDGWWRLFGAREEGGKVAWMEKEIQVRMEVLITDGFDEI